MALVDRRTDSVVLRVVYDGPPEAGKTTNVQQLCERISLNRRGALAAPGTDAGQRTQFFDWLDVSGGWVGGRRVHLQLVTVPGQAELLRRRRWLLDTADVVVFVADAQPELLEHNRRLIDELRAALGARPSATPGIIMQANKQDLPGALAPEALRVALGFGEEVPVVPAQAATGVGVMETFTLAVRFAVDRVRELAVRGALVDDDIDDASALHAAIRAHEVAEDARARQRAAEEAAARALLAGDGAAAAPASAGASPPSDLDELTAALDRVASAIAEVEEGIALSAEGLEDVVQEPGIAELELPPLPRMDVPAGLVWPPVRGRSALAALASLVAQPVRAQARRVWAPPGTIELSFPEWLAHTSPRWRHADLDAGRLALFEMVRLQSRLGELTPPGRTLALAIEDAFTQIWVLTPELPTWRDRLRQLAQAGEPAALDEAVGELAAHVRALLATAARAQVSIDVRPGHLARVDAGRSVYLGIPEGDRSMTGEDPWPIVRAEVAALLRPLPAAPRLVARLDAAA